MSTITSKDGAQIYFKNWGQGWPQNADSWDAQMLHLACNGFRCIAHQRRGHGRSTQIWDGNNMDMYAEDPAALLEALDLQDAILTGFSTGGGEVARYIGRYGTARAAKAALIGAVPPLMVKSQPNPGGLPLEVFDGIRSASINDRSQLYKDLAAGPFYGYNRPGSQPSPQGVIDAFWMQGMQAGHKSAYDCIKAFSERGEPFVSPSGHSWKARFFYLIASVAILLLGPGSYSLDRRLSQ